MGARRLQRRRVNPTGARIGRGSNPRVDVEDVGSVAGGFTAETRAGHPSRVDRGTRGGG